MVDLARSAEAEAVVAVAEVATPEPMPTVPVVVVVVQAEYPQVRLAPVVDLPDGVSAFMRTTPQ